MTTTPPDARYMAALVWLRDNDPEMGPAEFIARAARPIRWPIARFEEHDVERAARAIASDPGYFSDVARDARVTARRCRVGLSEVQRCIDLIRRSQREGA